MCTVSDGSTDSSIVEQETVYIRYVNKKGQTVCHFVDIVALESANADGILYAIDQSLLGIGITETTLQQKLVGCNFDDAWLKNWSFNSAKQQSQSKHCNHALSCT